jgi:PKHD-type hydroxylase
MSTTKEKAIITNEQPLFSSVCVIPDAIDTEKCFDILAKTQIFPPQDAQVGGVGTIESEGKVAKDIRRSIVKFIQPNQHPESINVHNEIMGIVNNIMYHCNKAIYGFDITGINGIQYTEYHGEDEGFYEWHHDWNFGEPVVGMHRKLSLTIQLSDDSDYEGGEFKIGDPYVNKAFLNDNKDVLKKRGTGIVFPSFLAHKVSPVTKGVRKSLVVWFEGPKIR